MLEQDITKERKDRHKITQEDFTPDRVVEWMYSGFPNEVYADFSKTILDPCAGIGNLLLYCIVRRIENCKEPDDVYKALETVYGTELMSDNVEECRQRIFFKLMELTSAKGWDLSEKKIIEILKRNIVCTDTFKWSYNEWRPLTDAELKEIEEQKEKAKKDKEKQQKKTKKPELPEFASYVLF